MAGAMRAKKPSSNVIRLRSSERSIDGATQRVSLNRVQSSPGFMGLLGVRSGQDGLALRLERGEQLVEGLDELLHALVLELLRGRRQVDADVLELGEMPLRVGDVL